MCKTSHLLIITCAIFCFAALAAAQKRVEKAEPAEVLLPLTEAERMLNPRELIRNQPDFVADLTFFVGEGFGGFGGSERIARKGNRYRVESPYWVFIGEVGKPSARLFPEAKTYDDFESSREEDADTEPLNPQALAVESDATFAMIGKTDVDGHPCFKIKVLRRRNEGTIYLYAARDLKNLVIAAQVVKPHRTMGQKLTNISLDVADSLVTIPADYKPVEHDRWTKIENATLTYKGRPSKDFGVFRAPAGELFIWVNDGYYPWHYLIHTREGIRETAFQGLLVTRTGEYIWQTKDTEAFSLTHYRVPRPSKWEKPEDIKVIVTPNSVKFRSIDFDKDKAMIEVRW